MQQGSPARTFGLVWTAVRQPRSFLAAASPGLPHAFRGCRPVRCRRRQHRRNRGRMTPALAARVRTGRSDRGHPGGNFPRRHTTSRPPRPRAVHPARRVHPAHPARRHTLPERAALGSHPVSPALPGHLSISPSCSGSGPRTSTRPMAAQCQRPEAVACHRVARHRPICPHRRHPRQTCRRFRPAPFCHRRRRRPPQRRTT